MKFTSSNGTNAPIYYFTPQRYELKKNNTKKLKDILYQMSNIVHLWIESMFLSLMSPNKKSD